MGFEDEMEHLNNGLAVRTYGRSDVTPSFYPAAIGVWRSYPGRSERRGRGRRSRYAALPAGPAARGADEYMMRPLDCLPM